MRTSDGIYREVRLLVTAEALATRTPQGGTRQGESDKAVARAALLPLLREAAGLRDIDLLLWVEQAFLEIELEHLDHTSESLASFNKAIRQVGAAIVLLDHVRVPDEYRWTEVHFTLPENLVGGLPKDEAHQFFASHGARMGNALKLPPEADKAALINARIDNLKLARDIYEDLQRRALTASEIREPSPSGWILAPAGTRANQEVREPAKPYKHRLAA